MQDHAAKRSADQDAKIDTDLSNIETEEVRHDEKENTDWREVNENGDDLHYDLLDLFDCTDQGAARLDAVTEHNSSDEYGQQRICSHGVDDVVWYQ